MEVWPIDENSKKSPEGWKGWPEGKQFALVLTHDVDTVKGHERCLELVNLEEEMGFRSSFNFVAKRYDVDPLLRDTLINRGFEVGVHGVCHDGKYFRDKKKFRQRAVQLNHYLREWKSVGFRSPSMHHNLEWIHDLNLEYDASTFDTDPFEPQSDGVGTVFPFLVRDKTNPSKAYVELPYTLPQDFTLFIILKEKSIDIWLKKLNWIATHGGMALLNAHPDYMSFSGKKQLEEYPADFYRGFLEYVRERYSGKFWHVLPKEMARFWRGGMKGNDRLA